MRTSSRLALVLATALGSVPLACLAFPAGAAEAADAILATVGDRQIKRAEVEDAAAAQLVEIKAQRYEAMRQGLDSLIEEELFAQEAKARGLTPEALEQQEVVDKAPAPTDAEIQEVYDANKARMGGQTLEQMKPRIVQYLKAVKEQERRAAFVAELKAKYPTKIMLRPPVVKVETAGRPERGGGESAPVTIIEFSDYQCPFCKRAEDTVDTVLKTYGDKVRLVFRDFPLEMHPQARGASEAAKCANAQGKFWEYHAKLFANQQALAEENLKAYAAEVGLDGPKFDQCLADKTFAKAVDEDLEAGGKVGVTGTPAFFVNGRMLSGAQPFEKFKEVIDEEIVFAAQ